MDKDFGKEKFSEESCLDSCSDSLLIPISQIRIYISHDDTLQMFTDRHSVWPESLVVIMFGESRWIKILAKKSLVNE